MKEKLILPVLVALSLGIRAGSACESEASSPIAPFRSAQTAIDHVMSQKPSGTESIMIIGDSIAELWRSPQAGTALGATVFNFGLASDQTSQVLWRLARADLSQGKFKRIILIIGSNNLQQEPCEIVAGVLAVEERLRTAFPDAKLEYISILPRGPNLSYAENKIVAVNQQIKVQTMARGGGYIDAYTAFRQACDHDDKCALYRDLVHPSVKGYELLGRLVRAR
jgi:hypothetical protein